MSVTYPDHIAVDRPVTAQPVSVRTADVDSAPYTPVYARSGKARTGRKAVKTWMILAPIGAVVLIGGGVAMALGGETADPVSSPGPVQPAPFAASIDAGIAPPALQTSAAGIEATSAPVGMQTAEGRRATPALRPPVEAVPAATPVETAPTPTGPQPYVGADEPVTPAVPSAPAPPTPVLPPEAVVSPPVD